MQKLLGMDARFFTMHGMNALAQVLDSGDERVPE
jgi:hypothetical protein